MLCTASKEDGSLIMVEMRQRARASCLTIEDLNGVGESHAPSCKY